MTWRRPGPSSRAASTAPWTNWKPTWRVFVGKSAQKALARVPASDAVRLAAAIREMATDPYAGDIRMLAAHEYRRRVGSYRIRIHVNTAFRAVQVLHIDRRTSTTYRRR